MKNTLCSGPDFGGAGQTAHAPRSQNPDPNE